MLVSIVFSVVLGLNWVAGGNPSAVPVGETPQSALARIGGSVYRAYDNPFIGDTDKARIRLVRYGMVWQPSNAAQGSTWQLGNEINLIEQDNAARSFEQARDFAIWYKTMLESIRNYDKTARIIGPSVWNWDGAGSSCCVKGSDSYNWFFQQYRNLYGGPPPMDYLAVQIYPWNELYWNDPHTAVGIGLAQVEGARDFRTPIVVTEWGMLRKNFGSCSLNTNQTEQERSIYTAEMVKGFDRLGVQLALYYGSHEQVCDSNGYMSWLINRDGSLTVEGLAHRNVVIVPLLTPLTSPQPTHRTRQAPTPMVRS